MSKTEYLSNEILEDDYIRSFALFHFIQICLGSCRIDVRSKFVTSPTIGQKIYSLLCAIIALILHIYVVKSYLIKFIEFRVVYFASTTSVALYYIIFICNVIHVRFMNSNSNPKFYLQLQEIDRLMKFEKGNRIYRFLYINNVLSVTLLLLIIGISFLVTIYANYHHFFEFLGLFYTAITCVTEWLYCADLMAYFFLRTWLINGIIENHLKGKLTKPKRMSFPTMNVIRALAAESYDLETCPTEIYLKAIMNGFDTFQQLYKFQMVLFCFQFVLLTLLAFESAVTALQKNALQWSQIVSVPTVLIVNLSLAVIICLRCELFLRSIKKTRRLCIRLMSRYHDGPLKVKAKKMLNIIQEHPGNFNVYNMWNMNAMTIVNMLNINTTMMIALLQFAYL